MEYCYYHSNKEAKYQCTHCKKNVCEGCTILVEGEPYCQLCWEGFVSKMDREAPKEPQYQVRVPWDRMDELGLVQAFYQTGKEVLLEPVKFFERLPSGENLTRPMLYAIVCILLFFLPMNLFYIKVFYPFLLSQWSEIEGMESGAVEEELSQGGNASGEGAPSSGNVPFKDYVLDMSENLQSISFLDILFMQLDFLVYYIIIASWIQHLLVRIFQGRHGYKVTFEVRCYAMIIQCLRLIPFLGAIAAELGSLYVCTRGFQIAQRLSFPHALFVACVPAMIYMVILLPLL